MLWASWASTPPNILTPYLYLALIPYPITYSLTYTLKMTPLPLNQILLDAMGFMGLYSLFMALESEQSEAPYTNTGQTAEQSVTPMSPTETVDYSGNFLITIVFYKMFLLSKYEYLIFPVFIFVLLI
jgi:hypothetical protein